MGNKWKWQQYTRTKMLFSFFLDILIELLV